MDLDLGLGLELWHLGAGLVLLLLGLVGGLFFGRSGRQARARAAKLETELREAVAEHDAYRARVEKHFEKTSEHFRELTEQYTTLYGHLAEGARSLCPEGSQALGRGLADPLLERGPLNAAKETGAKAITLGASAEELEPISEVSPLLDAIEAAPKGASVGEDAPPSKTGSKSAPSS